MIQLSLTAIAVLLLGLPAWAGPQDKAVPKQAETKSEAGTPQKLDKEGVKIEFGVQATGPELMEGADIEVQFKITDSATNNPLTGLHPAAWLDRQKPSEAQDCRAKIESFLQSSLSARADIDLNLYYVLALNSDSTITVVDPIFGYGGSKLLAHIQLKARGEDWRLGKDTKRLFVAMPEAGQVAVIEIATWKVTDNIDTGPKPGRLALQPDAKYLWVGREGGVTVIEATTLKVAARLETGAGGHDIAFSNDDRYAFVTNQLDGTLSIIDIRKLAKVKDLLTGPAPIGLAFSTLSKSVYVAHATDGSIAVVDGEKHELVTRIKARPGLKAIRFVAGGRWGFVVSSQANVAQIFDASTNRITQTAELGKAPDQINFTENYAFVRLSGSEQVNMIDLSRVGKPDSLSVAEFPGGQSAPDQGAHLVVADAIIPAPEGNSVLLANPKDKTIYYYQEGMAAPMGNFQNYGHEPMAVMVVDRSLREIAPGVYSAPVKLTASGKYDVVFLLSSPRATHCFEMAVKSDPKLKRETEPLAVEPLLQDQRIPVGKSFPLRFRLTDPATQRSRADLQDVRVLIFLAPGTWQRRDLAHAVSDGIYEVDFTVPQPGVYYVFYECPSLRVRFQQLPGLILYAPEPAPGPSTAAASARGEKR